MIRSGALLGLMFILLTSSNLYGSQQNSDGVRVFGTAVLEKRSTMVPMVVCDAEPCSRPRPYWSLVVFANGIRFEVDHVFALGEVREPETVELEGVVIYPGTKVGVDAKFHHITDSYYLLTDVSRVELEISGMYDVTDSTFPDLSLKEPRGGMGTQLLGRIYPIYGWSCAGGQTTGSFLYVRVAKNLSSAGKNLYEMQALASTEAETRSYVEIAKVEGVVNEEIERNYIIYSGADSQVNLSLSVGPIESSLSNIESTLKISTSGSNPIESTVPMICNPILPGNGT